MSAAVVRNAQSGKQASAAVPDRPTFSVTEGTGWWRSSCCRLEARARLSTTTSFVRGTRSIYDSCSMGTRITIPAAVRRRKLVATVVTPRPA